MARRNLILNPCVRCGRDSVMACPLTDPLEDLLAALEAQGYKPRFDEIDARAARDAMSACTNCSARGRFAYVGMFRPQSVGNRLRSVPSDCDLGGESENRNAETESSGCDFGRLEASYRAFWICERCSHWVEV